MPNPQPAQMEERMEREVLLLASYCGDDNPTCTEARPCSDCLAMCNVFDEKGDFLREFGALTRPAASPGEYGELVAWLRRDANRQDGTDVSIISTNAMRNAADRLETQAATIARLREDLNEIIGEITQLSCEDDGSHIFKIGAAAFERARVRQFIKTAALSPNPISS